MADTRQHVLRNPDGSGFVAATGRVVPTTAVVAELLITGLFAEAWITHALLSVFGTGWLDIAALSDWSTGIVIAGLALAYVLGVLVDRLADTFIEWLEEADAGRAINDAFSKRDCFRRPAPIPVMRLTIMDQSPGIATFLDYQRTRWRIARGAVFNVAMILVTGVAFLLSRTSAGVWSIVAFVLVALGALFACYFASVRILGSYVHRLSQAFLIRRLAEAGTGGDIESLETDVAAAVCYRSGQLLLVRTRGGGQTWTFPKGHRRDGESAAGIRVRLHGATDGRAVRARSVPRVAHEPALACADGADSQGTRTPCSTVGPGSRFRMWREVVGRQRGLETCERSSSLGNTGALSTRCLRQ
jgi:hypothetical protein